MQNAAALSIWERGETMKGTGKAMSMAGGLATGAAVSLGVTLAGTGVLAWLVSGERMDMGHIGYGLLAVLLLGSFLGAWMAFRNIRRRRLMVCLVSGGVYLGILLGMTALFFGGQYSGVGTTALLILAGCMAAFLLGGEQGRGGKHRKIRLSTRR